MSKRYLLIVALVIVSMLYACSKKSHPSRTPAASDNSTSLAVKKSDSLAAKNAIAKRKEKVVIPKVISVNDSAARKSVDGRYYYDVLGHRYWRNNQDGKYYLFNKSMYTNSAFKAPDK